MTNYAADRHSAFFRRNLQAIGTRTEGGLSSLDALIGIPLTPVAIDEAWVRHQMLGQPPEVALRRFRNLLMMALIERDVRGEAPLEEVLGAITHWAEVSVRHALQVAATELQEQGRTLLDSRGRPQDMLVVGMGKLGGGELNVSSDIDLIYVARDAGEEPRYLERIARRLGQLLSNVTADGFVFRVDTRLRPYGDVGPLIATLPALGSYFHEQGREWERFAWLKGRVIAHTGLAPFDSTRGDEQQLMQQVVPFVFRPYLDFPAFTALAKLHDMIRTEAGKTESRRARSDNAGFDVKLGRGGIREIEFCAQMFQIVRGGQDPSLRERSTPKALQRLARRRLLDESDVEQLLSAWRLLRRTEHALQYQEDAQTHWLSDDAAQHAAIAAMLGMSASEFDARLNDARNHVARVFDELLAPSRMAGFEAAPENAAGQTSSVGTSPSPSPAEAPAPSPESTDAPPTEAEPAAQPPVAHDPESQRRIEALRESRAYRKARDTSQQKVEHLLGQALHFQPGPESCGPTALIGRLCDFLESIAGRSVYLDMLIQHPGAFLHLLRMMAQARWASDYLRSHPVVIDELANGQLLEPLDIPHWTQELREQLDATVLAGVLDDDGRPAPDIERQMDAMREAHHGAGPGKAPDGGGAERPPERTGRRRAGSDAGALLGQPAAPPPTRPAVCRHCLRPAGWQGAGLFVRPGPGVPLRRPARGRPAHLCPAGTAHGRLAADAHRRRHTLRGGPAPAPQRQRRSAGVQPERLPGLPDRIGLGVGAPGTDPGALRRRQSDHRQRLRDTACRHPGPSARRGRATRGDPVDAPEDARRPPQQHGPLRPEARCGRHGGHRVHGAVPGAGPQSENKGNIELLRRAASAGLIPPEAGKAVGDAYRRYRRLQHEIRLNDAERARVPPATVAVEAGAVKALWQHLFS